jgi:hypothetical protein
MIELLLDIQLIANRYTYISVIYLLDIEVISSE